MAVTDSAPPMANTASLPGSSQLADSRCGTKLLLGSEDDAP